MDRGLQNWGAEPNFSATSEGEMLRHLKNLALTTALLGGLLLGPASASGLQMPDFAETERQYSKTLDKRAGLVERLNSLEDSYQTLVREIDRLKSSGGISTIAGRIELQNLLTRSKAVADELDRIQGEVRALDNRLQGQRSTLVTGIDRRVRDLEKSLGTVEPTRRGAIVRELNSLRQRRSGLATPLPTGPTSKAVTGALQLAEEVGDHPDELMAAADELQDTEDQLRRRLAAINGKLQDLRDEKTLVRRAQTFSREERFFEETDRDRVIAKFDRETIVANPRPNTAGPRQSDEGMSAGDDEAAGGNNGAVETADPGADEDFAGAPAMDSESAGGAREEPSLSDSPDGAEVAPPPAPSTGDPFETTRETIVIGGGSDPARSVGSLSASGRSVDGQIRSLEQEQKKLEKQAAELKKRAAELRRRARQL